MRCATWSAASGGACGARSVSLCGHARAGAGRHLCVDATGSRSSGRRWWPRAEGKGHRRIAATLAGHRRRCGAGCGPSRQGGGDARALRPLGLALDPGQDRRSAGGRTFRRRRRHRRARDRGGPPFGPRSVWSLASAVTGGGFCNTSWPSDGRPDRQGSSLDHIEEAQTHERGPTRRRSLPLRLISEAADASLTTRQRGVLARNPPQRDHTGPKDRRIRVARRTIDRWIRSYRAGGSKPSSALRKGEPVIENRLLDLAEALEREVPQRTAAQVAQTIRTKEGGGPAERPSNAIWLAWGSTVAPTEQLPSRSAVSRPHFPASCGPATPCTARPSRAQDYLFAFIDDHSRALVGYRWGHSEDTVRLEAAFRARSRHGACPRGVSRQRVQPRVAANCCGRAPASGSAWCIPRRRKAGED